MQVMVSTLHVGPPETGSLLQISLCRCQALAVMARARVCPSSLGFSGILLCLRSDKKDNLCDVLNSIRRQEGERERQAWLTGCNRPGPAPTDSPGRRASTPRRLGAGHRGPAHLPIKVVPTCPLQTVPCARTGPLHRSLLPQPLPATCSQCKFFQNNLQLSSPKRNVQRSRGRWAACGGCWWLSPHGPLPCFPAGRWLSDPSFQKSCRPRVWFGTRIEVSEKLCSGRICFMVYAWGRQGYTDSHVFDVVWASH